MKTELASPVATVEFSKFAGILSAALSQHHLLGFEIAQLEFHHLPLALFVVMLPKAHWNYPVYQILSCVLFQCRTHMAQLMSTEWGRIRGKGLWN